MAREFVLGARLQLRDVFTSPMKKVTDSTDKFSEAAKKANKHTEHMNKNMKQTGHSAHRGGQGILSMTLEMGKASAAMAILAAAAAPVIATFNSAKKAMNFEAQMSSIQALTGLTDSEMKKMEQLALEMGAKTKYSALQAGQGIEELLKAGIKPAQVQAGALEAALNLATAGNLELADAAEIMSTALNAFKSDAMTAAQASNILAGTANASATSVQELRYSLQMTSAVASGVGMSFKDTNIALGLFANNGLKGSDAGTSLKTMLLNLQPQTDKQIALFKKLGLVTANGKNQFFDATGKLKSLSEISGILEKSFGGLNQQQRLLAMEIAFGTDAIRAANILYKEGSKGAQDFARNMANVTALDVAKKKMDNAAGAVEQFNGAMETLQIAALMPTMPLIKKFALGAANIATKLNDWLGSPQAKTWGQLIITGVRTVGSALMPLFVVISAHAEKMSAIWAVEWPKLKAAAMPVLQGLRPVIRAVAAIIKVLGAVVRVVFPVISGILQKVLPAAGALLSAVGTIVEWLVNTIVMPLVPLIGMAFQAVWAVVEPILGLLKKAIEGIGWVIEKVFGSDGKKLLEIDVKGAEQLAKVAATTPATVTSNLVANAKVDGSHANGLRQVPFDGYIAELHKGERVLTANEARSYPSGAANPAGNTGGPRVQKSVSIAKLVDKVIIQGADQKNAEQLVDEFLRILHDRLKGADEILGSADMGVLL